MLDPLEPVIRKVLKEVADIKAPRLTELLRDDYGYTGSVDLVRKRLARMRPAQGERAAQRTGYRPGQVMQVDWPRCRRARGSPGASGASMRWSARCRSRARRRRTSALT
jgi:transposase